MNVEYFPKVAIKQDFRNNSNNHFEYTPFYFDGNIWNIDESLPEKDLKLIHKHFPNLRTKQINYPHQIQEDVSYEFWLLYQLCRHNYREEFWLPDNTDLWMNNKHLIEIPKNEVLLLRDALLNEEGIYSKKHELTFITEVKKILDNKTPYFVKLSCGTNKHNEELKPIYTAYDLLQVLCSGDRFLREYNSNKNYHWWNTHLVLTEWKNLEDCNEYRIILKNGKIRGICHSKWWNFYYTSQEDKFKLLEAFTHLVKNIVGYDTGVLDVYYDNNTDKAWLIEINCYGLGLSSGSGLFHWIHDYTSLCTEPFKTTIWKCLT